MTKVRGFTLVELLIVLVVLGVVAGLTHPIIARQIERSRAREALQQLDAVKGAMGNYRSLNGTYFGATYAAIGYDPNNVGGGQVAVFDYEEPNVTSATSYSVVAQRTGAGNEGNRLTFNEPGDIVPEGAYV